MDPHSNQPIRVLLVDDDEDDYLLARELFEDMNGGYALDWISNYDGAKDTMGRSEHDVYLLDYRLGRRTGLELLREATALGCMGPAIILTGQGERDIDVQAMQSGAADYLEKGRVDAALLERSIRYARERWRYQAELERRVEERTAELTHANSALQEADRRKDEFLATLAHELRNPLAPIRTGLELLRIAGENPSMREEVRSTMERQVDQMVRLVDDLLDVSRITRGKFELRMDRVELEEVVQNAVDATRPFIGEKRQQLTVELPENPVVLEADPARLAQVLANLLNNASKYTLEEGRIWLSATIDPGRQDNPRRVQTAGHGNASDTVADAGSRPTAPQVVLSVRDSGIGIPEEMLDQIFEMFAQVERPIERTYSGLGIGLTLVRSLVEMHEGTIQVFSGGPDRGSEFRVRLPLAEVGGSRPPSPSGCPVSKQHTPLRILVVDDNRAAADMLAATLKLSGNQVEAAYDGLQGVEAAETFRPHVALLDIGMPNLNGYDAARRIRQTPWGRDMRLVALTGWGQAEDKQRTKEAGFDRHLVKPVEPDTLEEILAELSRGCVQA